MDDARPRGERTFAACFHGKIEAIYDEEGSWSGDFRCMDCGRRFASISQWRTERLFAPREAS